MQDFILHAGLCCSFWTMFLDFFVFADSLRCFLCIKEISHLCGSSRDALIQEMDLIVQPGPSFFSFQPSWLSKPPSLLLVLFSSWGELRPVSVPKAKISVSTYIRGRLKVEPQASVFNIWESASFRGKTRRGEFVAAACELSPGAIAR